MSTKPAACGSTFILAVPLFAQVAAHAAAPDRPGPAQAPDGRAIFKAACAACHGHDGKGLVAPAIRPLPVSRAEALDIVRNGRGEMPAIPLSQLSGEALDAVLDDLAAPR